jgi:hypothetical protein
MVIYWDGDTTAAAAAAAAGVFDASPASREDARALQYGDACTAAQWRLYRGRTEGVDRNPLSFLARTGVDSRALSPTPPPARRCSRHGSAVSPGRRRAGPSAPRLAASHRATGRTIVQFGNLLLARLLETRGETSWRLRPPSPEVLPRPAGLPSATCAKRPLASVTGDRDGAIRVYQHYLAPGVTQNELQASRRSPRTGKAPRRAVTSGREACPKVRTPRSARSW